MRILFEGQMCDGILCICHCDCNSRSWMPFMTKQVPLLYASVYHWLTWAAHVASPKPVTRGSGELVLWSITICRFTFKSLSPWLGNILLFLHFAGSKSRNSITNSSIRYRQVLERQWWFKKLAHHHLEVSYWWKICVNVDRNTCNVIN